MSNLSWFGYFVYVLCLASIVLIATIASGQLRDSLKDYESQIRRFCLAGLLIGACYFYVTIPHITPSYDFSSKESYSPKKEHSVLLRDYGFRIEVLERDLRRLNEQSEKVQDHFDVIFFILLFGLLFYGLNLILCRDDNSSKENPVVLGLEEK